MILTIEQENIVAIYRCPTRIDTISAIQTAMKFLLDSEDIGMFSSCLKMLESASDEEFTTYTAILAE